MKYRLQWIVILAGLMGCWAQAQECPNIRLDQDPQVLAAVPTWNQGSTNLCYAFAATELIDAHRLATHPENFVPTSPLSLSMRTIRDHGFAKGGASDFYGGWIQDSLAVARVSGVCEARFLKDGLSKKNLDTVLSDLKQFYIEAQRDPQSKALSSQNILSYLAENGLQNSLSPSQEDLEQSLAAKTSDLFIVNLLSPLCELQSAEDLPETQTLQRSFSDGPQLKQKLQDLLSQRKIVAVNFCSEVAAKRSFSPGYEGFMSCARHYAVAVGQRTQAGQCQILVRDSLCSSYVTSKKESVCEEGQFWINVNDLIMNTDALIWL